MEAILMISYRKQLNRLRYLHMIRIRELLKLVFMKTFNITERF